MIKIVCFSKVSYAPKVHWTPLEDRFAGTPCLIMLLCPSADGWPFHLIIIQIKKGTVLFPQNRSFVTSYFNFKEPFRCPIREGTVLWSKGKVLFWTFFCIFIKKIATLV